MTKVEKAQTIDLPSDTSSVINADFHETDGVPPAESFELKAVPFTDSGKSLRMRKDLYLLNGLQPMGVLEITNPGGEDTQMQVGCVISLPVQQGKAPTSLLFGVNEDEGRVVVAKPNGGSDGYELVDANTGSRHESISVEEYEASVINLPSGLPGDNTKTKRITVYNRNDKREPVEGSQGIDVRVSAAAHGVLRTRREWSRQWERFNPNKRRPFLRKAIAAFAVYSSLTSGGLVDKLIDQFADPSGIIGQVADDTIRDEREYQTRAEYDGIALADYNPTAQKEIISDNKKTLKNLERASDALKQTFDDLDSHSYGKIKKRAEQFISERTDMLSPEEIISLKSAIKEARSRDELVDAFNKTMNSINVSLVLDEQVTDAQNFNPLSDGLPLKDVKKTATAIIDATGWMPGDFLKESLKSPKFHIGSRKSAVNPTMGENESYSGTIFLPALSDMDEVGVTVATLGKAQDVVMGGRGGTLQEGVIYHELGHSHEGRSADDKKPSANEGLLHILRTLIQDPQYNSMYGLAGGETESDAEDFAAIFTSMAHPDEVRRFNSEATRKSIEILYRIEQDYPGMTDLIIANNPRLIGRGFLEIGRD